MRAWPAGVAIVVLLASLADGQDSAQDENSPDDNPRTVFERLDTDGDGSLSREELSMLSRARFQALDEDEDDALSLEEFRELASAGELEARFHRLDVDEDGRILVDDAPESLRPRFQRADTNGDGFVDSSELRTMMLRDREARNGPSALMRRLMELDVDGDGRLHRDELPDSMEFLRSAFERFDVDGDGHLDGAELRAMTEEGRRDRFRNRRR